MRDAIPELVHLEIEDVSGGCGAKVAPPAVCSASQLPPLMYALSIFPPLLSNCLLLCELPSAASAGCYTNAVPEPQQYSGAGCCECHDCSGAWTAAASSSAAFGDRGALDSLS